MKKILISIPEGLLKKIDEFAASHYMKRAEFIRAAVRCYIKHLQDD